MDGGDDVHIDVLQGEQRDCQERQRDASVCVGFAEFLERVPEGIVQRPHPQIAYEGQVEGEAHEGQA